MSLGASPDWDARLSTFWLSAEGGDQVEKQARHQISWELPVRVLLQRQDPIKENQGKADSHICT
jgi:hypothetical protein